MPQGQFLPEGSLINSPQNRAINTPQAMDYAMESKMLLEGNVTMCDAQHNLLVDFNGFKGVIPRAEAAYCAGGVETREIAVISRVGKPVCFEIIGKNSDGYVFSRAAVQKRAMDFLLQNLFSGDVISVRVTHLEPFGAFVDIACGIVSLIGIEHISVSRIAHPAERFLPGQFAYAVVTDCDFSRGRISLSCRELLGTWQQNAARFEAGQTLRGIVRGTEDYGAFIELSPNISGLAERHENLSDGMGVSVFIKSIIPDKMKVKLIIIDALESPPIALLRPQDYFITSGHIDHWRYSPETKFGKIIETYF